MASVDRAFKQIDQPVQLENVMNETERIRMDMEIVLQIVRDGIVLLDKEKGITFVNAAYRSIIGLDHVATSADDLVVLTEDGFFIPFGQWPFQRVLRGDWVDPPTIYRIVTASGDRKVVEIEVVPLATTDVVRALGVVRDITTSYREAKEAEILRALAHQCSAAIESVTVAQAALNILMPQLGLGNATILVHDDHRAGFARLLATCNGPEFSDDDIARLKVIAETTPISPDAPLRTLQVLATGQVVYHVAPLPLPGGEMAFDQSMRSVGYLPLKVRDETIGVLMISFTPQQDRVWEAPSQALLEAAAEEIALALHRARLYENTQRLALYDPLTGLANHRALQQKLEQELSIASRLGIALSVIMLDVDHFRQFNEMYGHDIGDRALRAVADAIAQTIRNNDYAARYGGEEFTVILPATDTIQGASIAERIRAAIAEVRLVVAGEAEPLTVTASLGISTYPLHASVAPSLLKAADIALYASKHSGRNTVTTYSPTLATSTEHPNLPAHATLEMVQALIMGIDLRDGFTASHSEEVARLAAAIAVQMGQPPQDVEIIHLAGLVHDVGKIAIPEGILTKHGPLTADERRIMEQHSVLGERLLAGVTALRDILPFVRSHHERLDGSGYPDGLRGDAIPLLLRILSVADVFEAVTAARPYHQRRSVRDGLTILRAEVADGKMDETVVDALAQLLETPQNEDVDLVA